MAENGEGAIVAFASLWRSDNLSYLHNLFVAPDCQGRGIGRGLLGHVLGGAGRPVELKTDTANDAARQFYRVAGFREVGSGASNGVPWLSLRLD